MNELQKQTLGKTPNVTDMLNESQKQTLEKTQNMVVMLNESLDHVKGSMFELAQRGEMLSTLEKKSNVVAETAKKMNSTPQCHWFQYAFSVLLFLQPLTCICKNCNAS